MATSLRTILTSLHGRLMGLDKNGGLVVKGEPDQVTITPAAGAANISLVSIQVKDNEGNNFAGVLQLFVWLSDAATGAGLTATTASGVVAAGASGADMGDLTSKKAKYVQTNASGLYILSITDTAKTAFKVCVAADKGRLSTPQIATLITANYG